MPQRPGDPIKISAIHAPFHGRVLLPGSKSITNRALALASVARGPSILTGVLLADDTRCMIDALRQLNIPITIHEAAREIRIEGAAGPFNHPAADLFCQNAGTAIRFLTALCAASPGKYTLDGTARMRLRPIGQLIEALGVLGSPVKFLANHGYPPLMAGGGIGGGQCSFESAQSSQYISAVLIAAPLATSPVDIKLVGPVTSEPYVRMTISMMQAFGVTVESSLSADMQVRNLRVASPAYYTGCPYAIEPDASNASYFLAAAAVIPGSSMTIPGLGRYSLQGDVLFGDVLRQMGADVLMDRNEIRLTGPRRLEGITIDMNAIPDMVQTLAVVAMFADSPTRIVNVPNLRLKETDRLAALETELKKLGAGVRTTADSIEIFPATSYKPAALDTYDDHRMAMAFAVAGLRIDGVQINDPQCTAKTYPDFFSDFSAALRARPPH